MEMSNADETRENRIAFDRWFKGPIDVLLKYSGEDGELIALIVTMVLYERYAFAVRNSKLSRSEWEWEDYNIVWDRMREDFKLESTIPKLAAYIWEVFRNGLLHQAMPKRPRESKCPEGVNLKWELRKSSRVFNVRDEGKRKILELDPHRFIQQVMQLWESNMHLFNFAKDYNPVLDIDERSGITFDQALAVTRTLDVNLLRRNDSNRQE